MMNVTDFSQHGLRSKLDILRRELYDADYETKAGYFCYDVSKEIDRLKEANLRQGVKIGDLDRENRTVLSVKSLLTQQLVAANGRVELFAWATFDGEGSYDLRLYQDNENYRDEYIRINGARYAGWVIPLYITLFESDKEKS